MNETGNDTSIRAVAVPLPPLDISSPEAATASHKKMVRWIMNESRGGDSPVRYQALHVRRGLDFLSFKSGHESPALKQLVQEAIDKLRAMLASAA